MRRSRAWLAALAALALALVAAQLALPRYLENRVADRLTKGGGRAEVALRALPAPRLLLRDGDRISIHASGLDVPLAVDRSSPLDDLDGFGAVSIGVTDSTAGPVHISAFDLSRTGGAGQYELALHATATVADLSRYGGGALAGPVGSIVAGIAAGALPSADRPIPFDFELSLTSESGRPRVVAGAGSVAGVPTGPLAELVAGAVLASAFP